MYLIVARFVVALRWDVDELEDQRSSCYDARAPRQEVAANDVLEDGRFAGRLRANYDLCMRSGQDVTELVGHKTYNLREI